MKPFSSHVLSRESFFSLLVVLVMQVASYYYFKVYRGLWAFSSMNDLIRIMKALTLSIVLAIPVLYLSSLLTYLPRSILPIYCMVLTALLCGGRFLLRIFQDEKLKKADKTDCQRVLIIGAGHAGESLIRDLKRTKGYLPVGLIDDNPSKRGLEIHGIRVLGGSHELLDVVSSRQVEMIFIAIPSARATEMRRIVALCEKSNVPFRTLPGLPDLISGLVQINALREVNIEDLLGRDQVHLQWDKISLSIFSEVVAVTGAGGSIGSELCRQIMRHMPEKLLLIDNCEYNLYAIEQELQASFPNIPIEPLLISVTDKTAIDYHFRKLAPKMVFHAAAFKHVPLMEGQIRAAVLNNILGTEIVAEASVAVGVEKFILVSTDKAVNPANIMGTTKRVAELYCQNLNEQVNTQFITVRFGNVLGSAGSVVPLFQKQLKAGGPLTVTHPDIERYFMTIPEASQLILQAMVSGGGGEIFVLDMGEPIKISYLAEQMIRLAGKVPGKDIEIRYTGLRAGEKLYEELFHESEHLIKTDHEKLFKARFRKLDWNELSETMHLLQAACMQHENGELHVLIKSLVPEYSSEWGKVLT
jgi:FlaA1/EpsC-like NDP-sugar epimerase